MRRLTLPVLSFSLSNLRLHVYVTYAMSARTRSVSAVIQLVNAPQAFRIDVVGPDPPPVLLPLPPACWAWSGITSKARVRIYSNLHRDSNGKN
jgi:hypothetical protein